MVFILSKKVNSKWQNKNILKTKPSVSTYVKDKLKSHPEHQWLYKVAYQSTKNGEDESTQDDHDYKNDLNKLDDFRISILGQNQLFGFQECIEGMKRLNTVKCINNHASVYFISRNEFVERFNTKNEDDLIDDEK